MSAAPPAAAPAATPGPQDQGENRHSRLLGLLRRIMDYGRDLVATLQRQNTPAPSRPVAMRFGTFNLTLIIARITRGLAIAARLDARLSCTGVAPTGVARTGVARTGGARPTGPDHPARPRRPRPARPEPPPRAALSQSEDDAALLRGLPSADAIAARIRHRTAGAVIVEICRDLGIDTTHPLWRDIRDAIIQYDGSLVRMMKVWTAQGSAYLAALATSAGGRPLPSSPLLVSSRQAWDLAPATSTGPP